MSLWLLAVAIGNFLVAAFSELPFNLAYSFFFYAGLMFIFMLIFVFLTRKYKYVEEQQTTTPSEADSLLSKNGTTSTPDQVVVDAESKNQ